VRAADADHAAGRAGIDQKAIAEIAGHASIRTTAMHVKSNPKRLARILQDVTF
jgi:site-specific recombinase XerD